MGDSSRKIKSYINKIIALSHIIESVEHRSSQTELAKQIREQCKAILEINSLEGR